MPWASSSSLPAPAPCCPCCSPTHDKRFVLHDRNIDAWGDEVELPSDKSFVLHDRNNDAWGDEVELPSDKRFVSHDRNNDVCGDEVELPSKAEHLWQYFYD